MVNLPLSENKIEMSTAALRDKLEDDIVLLFKKLLLRQMRSVCLYHRNRAALIGRDMLREAKETVQHEMEQYNAGQSKTELQKLNALLRPGSKPRPAVTPLSRATTTISRYVLRFGLDA